MDYAYKPTTHGRAVMAACLALEEPLKITRVAFGSGKVAEDTELADVHELVSFVSDGAIAERRHEDDRLFLTVQYANKVHPSVKTFLISEFIVYVKDPETDEETDLLYGTLGDYRQPVPAYNPAYPPSVFNFPLVLIISDEINVSVSAPAGLVTWNDLNDLLDGLGTRRMDITIPRTGWTADVKGRYQFRRDIPAEGVTARLLPRLTIRPEMQEAAVLCGLSPCIQTLENAVRVWAVSAPTGDIPASLELCGDASGYCRIIAEDGGEHSLPAATATQLGGVRVGDGLAVTSDGTLSVDTASDTDVKQALAEVLTPDNQ